MKLGTYDGVRVPGRTRPLHARRYAPAVGSRRPPLSGAADSAGGRTLSDRGFRGARSADGFSSTVTGRQQERRNLVTIIIFNHAGGHMIVDLDSWEAGYGDGLLGRPSQRLPALDWFSYSSGYLQARARRAGTREDFRPRATRPSAQRAPQPRAGGSRLIII